MNRFKELNVWKKSIELTTFIYKVTRLFPDDERFGLTSQIRRCAVSIPSNIAEGSGRNSKKEFNNFLGISIGSSFELETQLIISSNLDYLKPEDLEYAQEVILSIQNMIYGLQKSFKLSITK